MSKGWKLLNRKTAYSSKFVTVYEDKVELPNGVTIPDYTVIKKPDIVIIVAIDNNGNIIILDEYKYAVNEIIHTLPAGHKKPEESPTETACRELIEETGYVGDKYTEMGMLYDYPSKDCHKVFVVLVSNIRKEKEVLHEETEEISFQLMSSIKIKELVKNKEFKSSSTLAALVISGILN